MNIPTQISNYTQTTQIPSFKFKQIVAKNNHAVLIDLDNNIQAFGQNEVGQLVLGD